MSILDFDFEFLMNAADFIDDQLSRLDQLASDSPDPDQFGEYDQSEYLCGFGFVACQTYLTAVIARTGVKKRTALDIGPIHMCGCSIVALVNAVANYWKHNPEWSLGTPSEQAKQTLENLLALGVKPTDSYPITNAMYAMLMPHNPRFSRLTPFLIEWRNFVVDTSK